MTSRRGIFGAAPGEPPLETLKGPPAFFARPNWEAAQKPVLQSWKKVKNFANQLEILSRATVMSVGKSLGGSRSAMKPPPGPKEKAAAAQLRSEKSRLEDGFRRR